MILKKKIKKYKYLVFIDLKNAYDKVIINTIKLIYLYAKLKISSKSEIINLNNAVLQGSLISPLLFDIYINDLIIKLNENAYKVLA